MSKPKSEFQDKWERSPGLLYFIAAGNPPKAVKIGVTTQATLAQRIRAIQNGNHEVIHVLRLIEFDDMERPMIAAEQMERELHRRFAHLRRFEPGWVGSEWFSVDDSLLAHIMSNGIDPKNRSYTVSLAKPMADHHHP